MCGQRPGPADRALVWRPLATRGRPASPPRAARAPGRTHGPSHGQPALWRPKDRGVPGTTAISCWVRPTLIRSRAAGSCGSISDGIQARQTTVVTRVRALPERSRVQQSVPSFDGRAFAIVRPSGERPAQSEADPIEIAVGRDRLATDLQRVNDKDGQPTLLAHEVAGVAVRILAQVILMVRLGAVPRGGRLDAGGDRPRPEPRSIDPRDDPFGGLALRR